MLAQLRRRTSWRTLFAMLALAAMSLKMAVPTGFMPGDSLARPLILCPGQGSLSAMHMVHGRKGAPPTSPHHVPDHLCAFAGLGLASLPLPLADPLIAPIPSGSVVTVIAIGAIAPGRGLAAPPPPSHAPPTFRT